MRPYNAITKTEIPEINLERKYQRNSFYLDVCVSLPLPTSLTSPVSISNTAG